MTPRHQWSEPTRFLYKIERTCVRCGLCKVTRHEPTATWPTWIEWWRDGERIKSERTPVCVAVEVVAS